MTVGLNTKEYKDEKTDPFIRLEKLDGQGENIIISKMKLCNVR